ncbi:MAG: hypothetical protein IJO29_09355 [Oscillospiraceae bacterium]|nr:hypothetical protein [Oscillospiraceae bacterium]
MKKILKRLTSMAVSLSLVLGIVPSDVTVSQAADEYLVHDPFFNYSYGYNYYESEHFQFIWGNSGDYAEVTTAFLEGNAQNLEACWDVYMNDLGMEPPSQSVNLGLRDGNYYKTNIYISGTGLSGMTDDWAYMSYDSKGFAYMFCCVDSMQYNPPSWVLPHEFGHVVTAHQLGWNTNKYSYAWWEAMGNWFREQYLYSDYSTDTTGYGTDFFETYLKNLALTFPCGRDYYAAWPFLQYLTENPDNLDGYGEEFVKTMLQEGQVDEYPFDMVERLAAADLKDTLGHFAKHMAGLDFENGDSYRLRLNELLTNGSWNWQQIYTMLEPVAGEENVYQVPTERAPQHAGMNIVPLDVTSSTISVTLNGLADIEGADWRACIVQQLNDNSCVYSDLFSDGDTCTVSANSNLKAAYLTVVATPDNNTYTKCGLPYGPDSEFAENNYPFTEKERYPYSATIVGADIEKREVATGTNWWESYHNHSNGGGLVSDSATVDSTVYVGPNAKVLGSATVTGNARIEDYAVVQDSAKVMDNAVISGYAIIAESATISGNARVDDYAMVMGTASVSGNARVIESACVYGQYTMTDYACAKGMAFCMANGSVSGQGVVDGDYYDDGGKYVTKGTAFGWVSAQTYVDSLSYTDKLMYAYDFGEDSSNVANDRYNSTYAYTANSPLWEQTRTSASGVLTLNGTQYAQLDRGMLYTKDMDLQIAFLSRSYDDNQVLLHLGNDSSYIKVLASNDSGSPEVIFSNGSTTQKLTATAELERGKWTILRVVLSSDYAQLYINNQQVASGTITIDPDDIASNISVDDADAAYRLGADNNAENMFNGSVDFVRMYYSQASAPTETYSESETVSQQQYQTLVGDLDFDAQITVIDILTFKRLMLSYASVDTRTLAAADTDGNGYIDANDLQTLTEYVNTTISVFPAGTIAFYS